MNEVSIYPVGILRQLIRLRGALNPLSAHAYGHPPKAIWREGWRRDTALHALKTILADCKRQSAWNGYLAEPTAEAIYWTRCGHGWTKRRAMASLTRHIGEVQRDGFLRISVAEEASA